MATYKSDTVSVAVSAETLFSKLSNLENLNSILNDIPRDQIPVDQLAMLEKVNVSADTISFPGGPAGDVTLKLTRVQEPTSICLEGQGTPVPMSLALNINPLNADNCEAYVQIDIQIPMMLKPMVSGPLQKMADQFAQMLIKMPMAK